MTAPRICVAGVSRETRRHVRPVVSGSGLDSSMLAERGGLFALGAVIVLGAPSPRPSPPEIEDVSVTLDSTRVARSLSNPAFWGLLEEVVQPSLGAIFGHALERDGTTGSLPEGVGDASLGVLRPPARPSVLLAYGRPRRRLSDPRLGELSVPITDLRLVDAQTGVLDRGRFELVADRLRRRDCLLSVGVGRAWAAQGDGARRHWLQINNIHLDDNPLWPQ